MVRESNSKMFLVALGVTLVVFIGGIYAGWLISEEKIGQLSSSVEEAEGRYKRYRIMLTLQDNLPGKDCELMEYVNRETVDHISDLKEEILEYKNKKKIEHEEKFTELKKEYTTLYIQYWLQMRKYKERCDGSNITTMLFLFSNENCSRCDLQGMVLDYWKERKGNSLLIFPLNTDLDLEIVKMITRSYGVKKLPTLVVNANRTYEGFRSKSDLREILQ